VRSSTAASTTVASTLPSLPVKSASNRVGRRIRETLCSFQLAPLHHRFGSLRRAAGSAARSGRRTEGGSLLAQPSSRLHRRVHPADQAAAMSRTLIATHRANRSRSLKQQLLGEGHGGSCGI